MKVLLNNNINPSFRSHASIYRTGNNYIGTFTSLFREDLQWKKFANYQIEQFKDRDKVNIVQFGASDGSEAYTEIISLLENAKGRNVDKFFPLNAYDLNSSMVRIANSGLICIDQCERYRLDCAVWDWFKYFKPADKFSSATKQIFKVEPILKDRVIFQQGDMFKLLPNIQDDSNTVLLCRNCLAYSNRQTEEQFIQLASNILKPKSLFAIGILEQDRNYIENLFTKNGFNKIMMNVFERI